METPEQPTNAASSARLVRWLPLALVVMTIVFVGFVRLRIADTPLERDEGEYAYGGQLILRGEAPYKDLYNIKLPGTYAAYAVIMAVFGQTPVGIHEGLLVVNALSIFLVYLIGRKISGATAGVLAAVFFAFLTLDPSLLGFVAQATHFVVLAALAGIYLLLRAVETERSTEVLLAGVCMGWSFLFKQPGVTFGVLGFAFVVWLARKVNKPSLRVVYGIGWLAPYILTCLILWWAGSFETFWIWTTKYAGSHSAPLSTLPLKLRTEWNNTPIWMQLLLVLTFAAMVWFARFQRLPVWKRLFLIGFVLCGVAAVFPGMSFYRHYFIMPAPAIALAFAVALVEIREQTKFPRLRFVPAVVGVLWVVWVIASLKYYLFFSSPNYIVGKRYKGNPFLQTRVISDYIATRCSPNGRIAVLQSEPEILFYTRRKSATGFIYAYDMTALGAFRTEMEENFKQELLASDPEYVVFVLCPYGWSIMDDAGMALADWCWQFPKTRNYTRVAVADNLDVYAGETIYKFDAEAANYTNRFPTFIEVYRRNGATNAPSRAN